MRLKRRIARLSNIIAAESTQLPTEFCVFRAGKNATSKGVFLFDAAAAKAVMADYVAQGNELMLDYAHAAIEASTASDPAKAGRAAGWFRLQLCDDGSLWAVNVRWTPDAAQALANREYRYTSPAFTVDESNRITSLLNVALVNIPATQKMTPLMAASRARRVTATHGGSMDPALFAKALDALESGDVEACKEIMKQMMAAAAAGPEAPVEEIPAEPLDEPQQSGDPALDSPEGEDEDAPAAMAAASRLMRLSGKSTIAAAVESAERWRDDSIALAAERAALAQEREALEASERDALGVALVTQCGRNPAAVWANPLDATNPKKRKLRKALATLSLADLRDEVRLSRRTGKAAATVTAARDVEPPATPEIPEADGDTHGLTEFQIKLCKERGIPLADFARRTKAIAQYRGIATEQ